MTTEGLGHPSEKQEFLPHDDMCELSPERGTGHTFHGSAKTSHSRWSLTVWSAEPQTNTKLKLISGSRQVLRDIIGEKARQLKV